MTITSVAPLALRLPASVHRCDARVAVAVGSVSIALASVFMDLSHASAATIVMYRCLLATPLLLVISTFELRRYGRLARKTVVLQVVGGILLGLDLVLATQALSMVGVGISTVLANVQIVVVPMLAWLVFGYRPQQRFLLAIPMFVVGVVLLGGTSGGPMPMTGVLLALASGMAYAVYVLIANRAGGARHPATVLLIATVSAGIAGPAVGSSFDAVDFSPSWTTLGWLLGVALCGQLSGWLLIVWALPRVSSATGATLLLIQPIAALLLGILLLGEELSGSQLLGCATIVATIGVVSVRDSKRNHDPRAEPMVGASRP